MNTTFKIPFFLFVSLCLQECALPAELPPLGGGLGYLIVAPRRLVHAGVLDEFVAHKRGLDFNVFVSETEEIAALRGQDFPEKLREYLKFAYRPNTFGPANVRYVLLIGGHDTIPHRMIYPSWPDRRKAVTYTDWYYADLVGDWDSNGDGMFGQGLLLREPPTDQAYLENYSIAVGRLPFSNDSTVELALDTIIRSETDPGAWKERALLVGAFMEFEGRSWTPKNDENGHYEMRGNKIGANTDNAVLMERVWEDILSPAGMRPTRLYETRPKPTPPGEPHSAYGADYALGEQTLIEAWNSQGHGLVNVAGHGASKLLAQYWWEWERIEDALLEFPTQPCCDELEKGHASYNEMNSAQFLNTGTLASLEPPDGGAPVVIVAGCGVAAGVDDFNNLGATFLAMGKASAFIGAIGSVGYSSAWDGLTDKGVMQDVLHEINLYLVEHSYRVGDAMWNAVAQRYRHAVNADVNKSKALIKQLLYGDPAMSYWGNGSASVGPWPMFRHDVRNSGRTPYPGPQVPEVKWTFAIAPVPLGSAIPSPIVGRDGTIYVGSHSGRLYAVNPDGSEKWHLDVGAPINCAPTLTCNGTLYFRAEDGRLHAVRDSGELLWHAPVELVDGSAGPTPIWPPFSNSPRVATDGTIYALAVDGHFNPPSLVLGGFWQNGELWNGSEFAEAGGAGTPAVAPDGTLYAGTWDGRLFHFDRFTTDLSEAQLEGSILGSPAVSEGRVCVGTAAGKMYALTPELEEVWHFDVPDGTLSRAINSSPAIGIEGNVYFGSWSDRLYALNRDGRLQWSYNTGGDVDSSPALDETTAYVVGGANGDAKVFAVQRFTGEERWVVPIGGNSRWGSSPAIGYDETIYVVSSTGQLIAIGPANGLGAPSDLSAEDSSADEIKLEWRDNSKRETGFSIERRTGWSGDFVPIATLGADAMRYTDTGLQPSTTYFYRVRALGSAPFSGYSNEEHARTARRRPTPPTGLMATADSATSIHLQWTGPDRNAVGVAVYRSATAAGPFARIGTAVGDASTFLDSNPLSTSGLTEGGDPRPGQTYFYHVRAFNAQGQSSPSVTVAGVTRALNLPAPDPVTAEVLSPSLVQIRWQDRATTEAGYVVERASGERAGYEAVATLPGGATSFEDATVESGWFTYRVRAVSPNSDSPFAVSEQVFVPELTTVTLSPPGAVWKYLDDGSDPGTAWRSNTFNDSAWPSGPAELGYGDGGEATVVRSNRSDGLRIITTYFRRAFTLANLSAFSDLLVRLRRDDGAIVYLNGTEVFRSNMPNPPATVNYLTPAIGAIAGSDETHWFTANISPYVLRTGANLIAVEVHQVSTNSSDVSFDLELTGEGALTVAITSPSNGAVLPAPAPVTINATATEPGGAIARVEFFVNSSRLGTDSTSPYSAIASNLAAGSYTLTAIATDSRGVRGTSSPVNITVIESVIQTTLISTGSVWRYLDDGSCPGVAWRETDFNDGAWRSGPAELGYGDGDEATLVRSNSADGTRITTTYFRRTFILPEAFGFSNLIVRLRRDDGGVVYLNGMEIFRDNMPSGSVDCLTRAIGAISGSDETDFVSVNVSPSLLRGGANVIAVEIHQVNPTNSSDISFELEVIGEIGEVPLVRIDGATAHWTGSQFEFRWTAEAGRRYQVQYKNRLSDPTWSNVGSPITASGPTASVADPVSVQTSRFYRVVRLD